MKMLIRFFISLFVCYPFLSWGEPVQGVEEIKDAIRNSQGHFERLGPWIIRYSEAVQPWMILRLEMNPKEAFVTEPMRTQGEFQVRLINPAALMTPLGNLKEIGILVYLGDNTGGQGTSQCEIYVTFMATGNYAPIDIERIYQTQRSAIQLEAHPPDRAHFVGFSHEKAYFRRQVGDVTPITVTLKLYDSGYWYEYQASLAACAAPFFPQPPQTTPQLPIVPVPPSLGQRDLWFIASNEKRMILVPEGLFQSSFQSHETTYLNSFYVSSPITHAEYAQFLNAYWKKFKRITDSEGHELILNQNSAIGQKEESQNIFWTIVGAPFRFIGRLFGGKPFIPFVVFQEHQKNKAATHISWYGAQAYCQFYDLSLPTEYQWEKALQSRTIQSLEFNEWMNAWYSDRVPVDFPLLNPQGPVDGTKKLYLRPVNTVLFYREAVPADYHSSEISFRCIKNIH